MKQKKIMHIIDTMHEGGAQVLIREYVESMHHEYQMIVVTIYNSNSYNMKAVKEYASVATVYRKRNIFTRIFNKLFGNLYIPYRYKKIISEYAPDVIHMHLLSLCFFKKIYKCSKGARLFYTCHSTPDRIFGNKRHSEGEAAKYLLKKTNLRIIALHDEMRKEINERFGCNNTVVVNNGIAMDRLRNIITDNTTLKSTIGLPLDSYVVGHVGRFVKVKNHDFLIDVFYEISKRKDNAYLLLIGNGELMENIREKSTGFSIDDRVIYLSDRTDVGELLHLMDVFIFPSFVEGLSIALLEAQTIGIRCIVSDSIDKTNFLTEDTIPVNLNKTAGEWADIALDTDIKNNEHNKLYEYDIKNSVEKLKQLYFGEDM